MSTLLEIGTPETDAAQAEEVLALLGRQFGEHATVGAVFGDPIVSGERTVIPVARVTAGFGGGIGTGPKRGAGKAASAPAAAGAEAVEAGATGSGVGGGGGLRVEPLAVVEITSKRVRVLPIVDVNRLIARVFAAVFGFALAALAISAFAGRRAGAARPQFQLRLGTLPAPRLAALMRSRLACA